jgi:hypothetical protein
MTDAHQTGAVPQQVVFHYIKSTFFRVAHADGVIGGITPRGPIHISFYSERPAIPQSTEQAILETGALGEITAQTGREGIVREMDIDIIITRQVAADLRDWLAQRIEDLDKALQRTPSSDKSAKK